MENLLKNDPLRTVLSLAGVSIGIFIVVVSFALVDAFHSAVVAGFDHFGSDMLMVERFPVAQEEMPGQARHEDGGRQDGRRVQNESGGQDGRGEKDGDEWSRYAMRPQPSREDYLAVTKAVALSDGWCAFAGQSETDVAYGGKVLRDCKLVGVMGAWEHLVYSTVCEGRNFSNTETASHDAKVIMGAKVAEQLFGDNDACGQTVRIGDHNMTVIGVLSYEGKNIINLYATDYAVIVPYGTAEQICGADVLETMIAIGPRCVGVGIGSQSDSRGGKGLGARARSGVDSGVKAGSGVSGRDATMEEVRQAIRSARRLSPQQEDNFALNTMEDLCRQTVALTGKITALGIIIALFSLLIGGFGIVNIMLVSVKERTWSIGLKKALGATSRSILYEFLLEALLLTVFGAAIGLVMAWGATALIPKDVINASLNATHILLAFAVSIVLGLASGLAPAYQAERLNPVIALRG